MVLKRTSCVPRAYAASPRDTRASTAELYVSERPTARAPDASRPRAPHGGALGFIVRSIPHRVFGYRRHGYPHTWASVEQSGDNFTRGRRRATAIRGRS